MKKEDSKQDLLVSGSLFLPKKAFQKLKIWSFKNELPSFESPVSHET